MPETSSYLKNEYFRFPIDNQHVLLTTRHGGWFILSKEEYATFKAGELKTDSELFGKLENAGIILTPKSANRIARDLSIQNNFLFNPTNYHVIAVTNKCNFNCIYCHPDSTPGKEGMSKETGRKVLDFIFSIPMRPGCQIVIEGGEPLLQWDLIRYLYQESEKRAKEKGIGLRFSFTTNLSLMTEQIAKELSQMEINPCISFDGPKEIHDQQRPLAGGGGTYDKVIYWAHKLKDEYKLKVHAIPVVTKIALKYGPRAIIDEYLKLGQESVFFKPFRASGRALNKMNELAMTGKEFFEFWKEGVEYCLELEKKGIKMRELNATYLISNISQPVRKSMCHRRPCGAGFSILSYNSDGTINGCDATRGQGFLDFGHVDQDNYQTIRSKALPLLSLTPDAVPVCSNCPFMSYCSVCLADNFGRENDIYPKAPRSFSCQWQKLAFEYLFKKFMEDGEDAKILRSWQNYC